MSDEQIKKLTEINQRLLLILGVGTSIIIELKELSGIPNHPMIKWFMRALENVVYLDEPLPPITWGEE